MKDNWQHRNIRDKLTLDIIFSSLPASSSCPSSDIGVSGSTRSVFSICTCRAAIMPVLGNMTEVGR